MLHCALWALQQPSEQVSRPQPGHRYFHCAVSMRRVRGTRAERRRPGEGRGKKGGLTSMGEAMGLKVGGLTSCRHMQHLSSSPSSSLLSLQLSSLLLPSLLLPSLLLASTAAALPSAAALAVLVRS